MSGNKTDENDILMRYYRSRQGVVAQHLIGAAIGHFIADDHQGVRTASYDSRVAAGIGFTRPFLPLLKTVTDHQIELQFGGYPINDLPCGEKSRLAEISGEALPLLPSSLEMILLVHGLEVASSPDILIDECWSALKGNGRLLLVVPHRGSFWANDDRTPFGQGQPYSQRQIRELLEASGFDVTAIRVALAAPPMPLPIYVKLAATIEHLPKIFGGVLVVEAVKMIYSVRPIRKAVRRPMAVRVAGVAGGNIERQKNDE